MYYIYNIYILPAHSGLGCGLVVGYNIIFIVYILPAHSGQGCGLVVGWVVWLGVALSCGLVLVPPPGLSSYLMV